jgi:integrase
MVRDILSLDLATFPASFRSDLARYEAIMSGWDLTAANAPDKPLRPDTLEGHLKRLRLFASIHVHSGVPVDQITGIETLFAMPNSEEALQWYRDKLGSVKPCLFDLAAMLSTMGRKYLQLDDTRLKELETLKKRLRCREWGMTGKVRKRLAQLRDPENQRLFLTFHDLLLKEARRYPSHSEAAAVLVQTALIHALLLVAPMRFRNLVMLCLDQHFAFARPGREGQVTIQIPDEQVKNGVALEYVLPDEVAGLLKLYLEQYRPFFLKDGPSPYLFPGKVDGHKHQVTLQGQLCRRLHEYTGIQFHPHAYRHASALFYLQRHPTDYETVRRLLGHRSLDTTIRFYMEFEQFLASTRYNAVIDEMRQTSSSEQPERRTINKSRRRK